MKVYLDNSATTAVAEEVIEAMLPYLSGEFGNAQSVHSFGQRAKSAVERARRQVAALINAVVEDPDVARRIVAGQYEALARLHAKDFAGTLLRHIEAVRRSPRKPHPEVAFDFWDQVEQAEALDELKAFRPSAFLALPPEPSR